MKSFVSSHSSLRTGIFLWVAMLCLQPMALRACRLADAPPFLTPQEIVAQSSNQFGIALYKQIASSQPTENQFMSPYSVFTALSMTSEGAAGESIEILSKVLGLPDAATLHAGLSELAQSLNKADAPFALAVANAIWPEQSAALHKDFVATISDVYKGACTPQDYLQSSEAARATINAWVEKKTNDRIKDLIPAGAITSATRMVLTNAIFFKGSWKTKFDKALTQEQPFTLEDGKRTQAQLMHLPQSDQYFQYAELPECQVLELPYVGDELSMVVLLPKAGKMKKLEAAVDAPFWERVQQSLAPYMGNVWLPRFKMSVGGSIKQPLSRMGLEPLFMHANFDRMFQDPASLLISDVFHKGFVEVNEEGTEAAAATAVVVTLDEEVSHPEPTFDFRADHPFLFMIQHTASKSILFMGKVMNPAE